MSVTPYTIDIDIGGTFTDGYLTHGSVVRTVKVFTTPHDLTTGVVDCIREGAAAFDVDERALLQDTAVVRLSTTIGTNTLVQRRGPRLGTIVSRGSEESLYRTDGTRVVPVDLLDPRMVRGLAETREADVLAAVRELLNDGARMIVIALRGAGDDPRAERSSRETIRARYPEHYLTHVPVQIATDVAEIVEDDLRFNTALLNGYLHRDMARTLYKVEDWLRAHGCPSPLRIVHTSGGVARVAKTKAIHTYSSGPTAAVIGASIIAKMYGFQSAVGADMGGTTLDIGLVEHETLQFNVTPTVAGIPIGVPMIETVSLGLGGGSIASAANGGSLSVGPSSAGAVPGPACYGKGGLRATVTDADLILGILDPGHFLGGRFRLFPDHAQRVLKEQIADILRISPEEAALRVQEETDRRIGAAVAALVHERDWDASELVLFAYGGSGPVHAAGIAAAAGIRTVMMFPFSSVFSAFGMSQMDVNHVYTRTRRLTLFDPRSGTYCLDINAFNAVVHEMVERALTDMRGEGFGRIEDISFSLDLMMRGEGMSHKIMIPSPSLTLHSIADAQTISERLRKLRPSRTAPAYEFLDTFVLRAQAATLHTSLPTHPTSGPDPSAARRGSRRVLWSAAAGYRETTVYDLGRLQPGHRVDGPAIIEAEDTVCPVPPGVTFALDKYRTGILTSEDR